MTSLPCPTKHSSTLMLANHKKQQLSRLLRQKDMDWNIDSKAAANGPIEVRFLLARMLKARLLMLNLTMILLQALALKSN